jgi:hypothetical protein
VLQWNTFLGGTGNDYGYGIAVGSCGNVYVSGLSGAAWGNPVRAYSVTYDAFAAKLNNNGVLQWNTFLGGTIEVYGNGIAVDTFDNVYVTGQSYTDWGNPVRAYTTGSGDAFVAKLTYVDLIWYHTIIVNTKE